MKKLLLLPLLLAALCLVARAADSLPPRPAAWFNDYANLVPPAKARQLNSTLEQFERATSNQIVVAIFPRLPDRADVADYSVRTAQSWAVGQKGRNNGAVLFLFQESRDVRIVTGYGLEGALPDALCKRIIEDEIIPRFRQGDFAAGLTSGVNALIAATKGEYQGTGRTAGDRSGRKQPPPVVIIIFIVLAIAFSLFRNRRNTLYGRGGRVTPWISTGGGGWSGGGGGGFSGGGGSFGGGGAGGKW